ncbi:MAG: hypothetical protein WC483_01050 [Candidatus Paceibacterota bacterium]
MATKYRVIEEGHAALLIEEKPKWILPSACLSAAFYADPIEVLKYGSNGLHFAEHILWNVTAKGVLHHTNASTFSTGEMAVYGSCLEANLSDAMRHFFGGLTDIASASLKTSPSMYAIEQRRVSCETSHMHETTGRADSEQSRMFVFNTDLVRSEYPIDYVWRILLDECQLGKVIVMANCAVSDETIALFVSLAKEFSAAWDDRKKHVKKSIPLPLYHAPPFSFFDAKRATDDDSFVFKFGEEFSPIERVVAMALMQGNSSPYAFAITVAEARRRESGARDLAATYDWNDPFFAVPILASYGGGGGKIDPAWVDELYSYSAKELYKRHVKAVEQKIARLMRGRTSSSSLRPDDGKSAH